MKVFEPKFVRIDVLLDNGRTSVMGFCTLGRGGSLNRSDGTPVPGMLWIDQIAGIWARYDNDETIADEIAHTHFGVGTLPVSWQRVTDVSLLDDRDYRNALKAEGGRLVHDLPMARERKRDLLREQRSVEFVRLDANFMRALGQGKKTEQDAIEIERQKWRDAPADPRIEAATSVEELKQIKVV